MDIYLTDSLYKESQETVTLLSTVSPNAKTTQGYEINIEGKNKCACYADDILIYSHPTLFQSCYNYSNN